MKLGLVTYQVAQNWDLDTLIANCREAGFEGAELRTTHAHGIEEQLSAEQRAEARKKFSDGGIQPYALGTAFDFHTPDQEKLRADIEATKRYLQLAADMGCEGMKVRPNGLPDEVPVEKTLEQIGRSVAEVAAAGKDVGVKIWLEVHGRKTSDPKYIKTIMDHADHSNAYVTWNCNPDEPDENGRVKGSFELLKERIGCVHMQELWDTARYPWQEIFTLLKGIGYQGWVGWEGAGPSTLEDAVWGMKCYRRIWEGYRDHA